MEKQTERVESNECVFDRKMEKPQRAALIEDWKGFKKFFEQDKKALLKSMDLDKNTAIHVVTRSSNPRLLAELLDMLSVADRQRALRRKNARRCTALHHATLFTDNVGVVDVLLKYEREVVVVPSTDEEVGDENEQNEIVDDDGIEEIDEDEGKRLVEMKNDLGETALYMAAKEGNIKMLQHMAKSVEDIQLHFIRDSDKLSILHIAIIGQHLDVAIWLMKVDERLGDAKDEKGLTALHLLSKMPFVFRSCCQLGTTESLVYSLLPEQYYEYEDYDESVKAVITKGVDLESGKDIKKPPTSGISRINYAIWNSLAREYRDAIGHVWKKKKKHKLAEHLADMLVQKDDSWLRTCNAKPRTVVVLPIIKPTNVAAGKKQLNERLKETQPTLQTTPTYSEFTPLLLAAASGIVEIVEKFIGMYPESIKHVSETELNVLHVAVITRQKKIYNIIKSYGALKMLAGRISGKGRSVLHQVARMEYYRGGHVAGYAYELQDELCWYERVKKIIPPNLEMHCNEDNLTAREQFEMEHADMLKEAQDWIKETAQSCSTVAVLVATVVFAAAYTVPGGTDARGFPVFLRSPAFLFFTIMDIVALASSLASVVMFLSILTSPFEMWEFHKSLPRKLTLGFGLLFFSLTAAMLSFSATVLLTVQLESNKWSSSLIYSAAFFPVSIFGLLQFPFYMAIKDGLLLFFKKLKKMIPSSIIKSAEKSKMRKYRGSS